MRRLINDFSISASVAGVIATLIAYAGPLVIIFQVAKAAALPADVLSSWVWAISIGSGTLGIILSLRYKVPVVMAWSAPGSALLVTLLPGVGLNEAVGAYVVANTLVLLIGLSGAFDRIVGRLPAAIAAAMLAGILFRFGIQLFVSVGAQPLMVLTMFAAYLVGKRMVPRYAVMAVLAVGCVLASYSGQLHIATLKLELATPVWVTPSFSLHGVLNIALPLAMVALTGQFVPGIAVMRNDGYTTPARPLIASSAFVSLLLSPSGCHGLNLAAITAAICTGRESHDDRSLRYVAGVVGGLFFLLFGIFGATIVSLFSSFPTELIAALAGLALFGAIGSALSNAMSVPRDREAALITFLATASGMTWLGLTAAFWGLIFGLVAHVVLTSHSAPLPAPANNR